MPTEHRLKIMLAIIVIAIITLISINPIAQDPAYHHFADQRRILDIDNFVNVISNTPFVIIGIIGMRLVLLRQAVGGLAKLQVIYLTFFVGVFLTGFGSAYYHLQPGNQTLVWDRLPMTIAFMALFSSLIGEYISLEWARRLFIPLLILGVASVGYWYATELNGHGDLRAYLLVQFLPILLIPFILCLFDSTLNGDKYIWGIIGVYALAKLMELADVQLYEFFGLLSGHSLKHLLAAFGAVIFYQALQKRSQH